MAGLHAAGVSLDTNEEWLVRNAVASYREKCEEMAVAEANEANDLREARVGRADLATDISFERTIAACERLSNEWARTAERVKALEEKLG